MLDSNQKAIDLFLKREDMKTWLFIFSTSADLIYQKKLSEILVNHNFKETLKRCAKFL